MPIPQDFSAPSRLSAKERAFKQIQEWIIDGTLQPGEKLNDTELAQALGVSRTPIREALQLLGVQGFVAMHPGVTTQVTALHTEDLAKILPPLAVLQALAAELATPIIDQETLAALGHSNAGFTAAIGKGDYYSALKRDEEFHSCIVEIVQNPYISNTVSMLQAHFRRFFFHNSTILTEDSAREHEAILAAFAAQDPEAASANARNNWLRSIERYNAP